MAQEQEDPEDNVADFDVLPLDAIDVGDLDAPTTLSDDPEWPDEAA